MMKFISFKAEFNITSEEEQRHYVDRDRSAAKPQKHQHRSFQTLYDYERLSINVSRL